jgi:hypothetical protein
MYFVVSKEAKSTSENLIGYLSLSLPLTWGKELVVALKVCAVLNGCRNLYLKTKTYMDRRMLLPCSSEHWFFGAMEYSKHHFVSVNNDPNLRFESLSSMIY